MHGSKEITKITHELIFVLYCLYKKFWSQSMFSIAYTKSSKVKPQFDRYFDSKSYQNPSQRYDSSCEIPRFVNIIHDRLSETFSIFYHSLHVWYHEILTNLMIFRLRLLFLEFKNHSATRSWSCFLNKMFEISFHFPSKASHRT